MSFTKRLREIFRNYETDGVASSGAHKPLKSDIIQWGTEAEAALDDAQTAAVAAATAAVLVDSARLEIARRSFLFNSAI